MQGAEPGRRQYGACLIDGGQVVRLWGFCLKVAHACLMREGFCQSNTLFIGQPAGEGECKKRSRMTDFIQAVICGAKTLFRGRGPDGFAAQQGQFSYNGRTIAGIGS